MFKITAQFQDVNMPKKVATVEGKEAAYYKTQEFCKTFAGLHCVWVLDLETKDKHVYDGNGDYLFSVVLPENL